MEITEEDITDIEGAVAQGGDIWNNPLVSSFKTRVKEYYRQIENEQCCYCKKNFQREFNMVIDIERYHIEIKGKVVDLPRKEFELLGLLASKPGKVFTRDEIMDHIWGTQVIVGGRTIDVHIRKLREK